MKSTKLITCLCVLAGCGGGSKTFQIDEVDAPASVQSDGPRGELIVRWTGNPTFPVDLSYRPRAEGCPPGLECFTGQMTFVAEENPLVSPESVWCVGVAVTAVFGYEVVLTDANGAETPAFAFDFTCEPNPT